MKAVKIINSGKNSSLEIQEMPALEPGPRELLIKIEATALNRADLLQRTGSYPPPEGASEILGLEMSGVVEATGPKVSKWQKGDYVMGLLPGGGYAEYCTIHEDLAVAVPEELSLEEAAAIPETFLTAYQTLAWLGELKQKETVLIHAGGSGVGTSAIQLARHLFDATIVTTAGKDRKLEACRELGADYAFNYKTQNFADEITDALGENAVDVIIDFIGEPYWHKNMEVLALDGRLVYLSFLGGHKIEQLSLVPILRKRLTVRGSTLRNRPEEYKIKLSREFADRVLPLFEKKSILPVIDSVFDWKEVEKAHQRMSDNKNTGKIVLTGM